MKRQEKLLKRLDRNYADYRAKVLGWTHRDFPESREIVVYQEMFEYLSDVTVMSPNRSTISCVSRIRWRFCATCMSAAAGIGQYTGEYRSDRLRKAEALADYP